MMRAFAAALIFAMLLVLAPFDAMAQSWTDQPFDPAPMSREDIATLQAALAFSGDYYGYTDGVWATDGELALKTWVQREEGTDQPLYRHLSKLILRLEDERVKNGWQLFYSETNNTSYLHPFELLEKIENPDAIEFLSEDKGLSLMVRLGDQTQMQEVHDWFYSKALPDTNPFRFNDEALWITSVSTDEEMTIYVRSDVNKGTWSSLSVVARPEYFYHLNLVAASMSVGGSPATLMWTEGGVIDQIVNGTAAGSSAAAPASSDPGGPKDQVRRPRPAGVAEAPPAPETADPSPVEVAGNEPPPALGSSGAAPILATPGAGTAAPLPEAITDPNAAPVGIGIANPGPAPVRVPGAPAAAGIDPTTATADPDVPRPKVAGTIKGSGTGFYIGPNLLVTAAHVVDGCSAVAMIDGTPLDILASDPSMDLAVLGGATDAGVWLKLSALEVPKLGEAVTALGYPYYTSLEQGLTVTSGNVSALRGIDGSSSRVMITAPVQPGNSGGPLLNKKGAVIGVVVSRVDDMAILEETGSLPQNMNFAVPSGPLLTFLAQSRIARPQGEGSGSDISGEVPDGVANAVVPLHCYQ